jgi:hypothetical protein
VIVPSSFKFEHERGQSFNRSRFSEPQDVLHSDCARSTSLSEWGVWQCTVGDIPSPVVGQDTPSSSILFIPLIHTPEETCYAHSELWCRRVGSSSSDYEEPPKKVKEALKIKLSLALKVIIPSKV